MKLDKIKNFILDLFFPKKCLGCGKHNTYLCEECFKKISNNGWVSLNCQKEFGLDRIISAAGYVDPLTRDLIKALKYGFARELAKPLSRLIIKHLESISFISTIPARHSPEAKPMAGGSINSTLIIPVPLHSRRLHERGFNQAELIAQEIADYFQLPIKTDILKRIRPTQRQTDLKDNKERKNNIKDAFEINDFEPIKGKVVLLIDDVITSGATLSEAAKILKQSGAKEVWAITVARG